MFEQLIKNYFDIKKHILIGCFLVAAFLFTYNINWGAPYYFHPDERNIASAVTRLRFPSNMNPEFFAYGSLPIYSIYFAGVFTNHFTSCSDRLLNCELLFEQAIIMSRIFSILLGLGTIVLLYVTGKKIYNESVGILASLLGVFSVGFIQFSHFGTFEMWLTFFSLFLFYLCTLFYEKKSFKLLCMISLVMGILLAIKVSSLTLLPLPVITILISELAHKRKKITVLDFLRCTGNILVFFVITCFLYSITNPYAFLVTNSFMDSMRYESSVALGTLPVFYTGEFISTTPVIFQFFHVYPFLLNPLLTLLFPVFFLNVIFLSIQKKNFILKLLVGFFVVLFMSQAVLFVKWTRYMVPTLPFIYLISAVSILWICEQIHKKYYITKIILSSILVVSFVCSISYFILVFIEKDTRIAALDFANTTITPNSPILSEVYDLGITPFNNNFHHIDLFNIYDLEQQTIDSNENTLQTALHNHDYIILPSQRIIKTRLLNKKEFPRGNKFYTDLISEKMFKKIYETPCDVFCTIVYLGDPINRFEETASVFDRPVVQIYQKIL